MYGCTDRKHKPCCRNGKLFKGLGRKIFLSIFGPWETLENTIKSVYKKVDAVHEIKAVDFSGQNMYQCRMKNDQKDLLVQEDGRQKQIRKSLIKLCGERFKNDGHQKVEDKNGKYEEWTLSQ